MSTIDKQRVAAVRKLEQLGYTFAGDDWMHPANAPMMPTRHGSVSFLGWFAPLQLFFGQHLPMVAKLDKLA